MKRTSPWFMLLRIAARSPCRSMAGAGGAVKEDVVQRFAALLRGGDQDGQVFPDIGLADQFVEAARPQRGVELLVGAADGVNQARLVGSHRTIIHCRLFLIRRSGE